MSFQPQPPQPPFGGPPPSTVPPPYTPPYTPQHLGPTAPTPARRSPLRWIGVALVVVGVVGGAVLYVLSGSTREQTIERFARAPVGCTTTLQFDRPGTFVVYLELTGRVDSLGGDCDRSGASYRWTGSTLPANTITMVDGDGRSVELLPSAPDTYDTGTWRGQAVATVQVTTPGSARITVDSPDTEFAVAVGGDPDADAATVQAAGVAVAVVGVVLGAVLVLVGRRRGSAGQGGVIVAAPAVGAPQYPPVQSAPTPPPPAGQYPPRPPSGTAPPPPPPGWGAPPT